MHHWDLSYEAAVLRYIKTRFRIEDGHMVPIGIRRSSKSYNLPCNDRTSNSYC